MRASVLVWAVAAFSLSWSMAQAATNDDGWRFTVAPYVWGAAINGDVGVHGVSTDVDVSFSDIVDHLDMTFMGQFEADKGKFGFVVNPVYLNLSSYQKGRLGIRTKVDLESTIVDAFATWRAAPGFDVLFGARYTEMSGKLRLSDATTTVSTNGSRNWTDAIFGFRFAHNFNDHWSISGRADVGGGPVGESDLTWSANAQIGYAFTQGFQAFAGYRYLDYDYKDGSASEQAVFDAHIAGPVVAVAWTF
jgi:hypothetical protein